ncbi:MAG: DUF5131 family protein [Oscillospiraceae bacterium]
MASWNPWHGCHKKSEGCAHCYVYRIDERRGRNSSVVTKTSDFNLPVRRARNGEYKIASGELIWTCFSSDFLVEDADEWRPRAWEMMRERDDCEFLFITKRIERLVSVLPEGWGDCGFRNITVCVTAENQCRADERLPIYLESPLSRRMICCEPLLGPVRLERYLGPWISNVVVGGESGPDARVCDFAWVQSLREQCDRAGCGFYFKQTGARFLKDGKVYLIPRRFQHAQALRAGLNTVALTGTV